MKGAYANMMSVSHAKEEFVLDFFNIYPQQGNGIATARVIVSPGHMKRIMNALKENVDKYEQSFGKIEEAKPTTETFGFHA